MFGYIRTDVPNLYMKDNVLYKSLYCGMCKAIRKSTCTRAKFALTYDIALFSALYHNILGVDVTIKKQHCMAHPFTKRPMTVVDELSLRLGALNTLLAYNKILDNIQDENKGRFAKTLFKKAYKKAAKKEPLLDEVIKKNIAKLSEIEKNKTPSIDIAADSFGVMTDECSKIILGDKYTPAVSELFYLLGKWIYLTDALDDFDKDKLKKRYNPIVLEYADAKDFNELLALHGEELRFITDGTEGRMAELLGEIEFHFNADLIYNIITRGMPNVTKGIFKKECKKCNKITNF